MKPGLTLVAPEYAAEVGTAFARGFA